MMRGWGRAKLTPPPPLSQEKLPSKSPALVSTAHGMEIDNFTFDRELWESMKNEFEMF